MNMRVYKIDDVIKGATLSIKYDPKKKSKFGKTPKGVPKLGAKFGNLKVVGFWIGKKGGLSAVQVKCTCDNPSDPWPVMFSTLRAGGAKNCPNCSVKNRSTKNRARNGFDLICPREDHRKRLLSRIDASIARCHNPDHPSFEDYGGRGITVSKEWREDRGKYLEYLMTLPGWDQPKLHLDRINNDRGYTKGNLRFVSASKNMFNKRNVNELTRAINEKEITLKNIRSEIAKIKKAILSAMLKNEDSILCFT